MLYSWGSKWYLTNVLHGYLPQGDLPWALATLEPGTLYLAFCNTYHICNYLFNIRLPSWVLSSMRVGVVLVPFVPISFGLAECLMHIKINTHWIKWIEKASYIEIDWAPIKILIVNRPRKDNMSWHCRGCFMSWNGHCGPWVSCSHRWRTEAQRR